MYYTPATKPSDPYPVVLATRSAVLLIFFMPPALTNRPERASLVILANALQEQLSGLVKVLRIDAGNHADVMQSFAITQTPAFVLLRRGIELWRQEGLSDEVTLVKQIQGLLI